MTISKIDYQEDAIEQLVKSISAMLCLDAKNKVCVFKSPTGSGKTYMVSQFINDIIKGVPDSDLCFLWVSIGKGDLHKQSMKSLNKIFDGFPIVNLYEDEFFGGRSTIEKNEVVVINWEKLYSKYSSGENAGQWKNKAMRDGEGINFIELMENTKSNLQIILIIDESHYASDTNNTNELRDIINPDLTLEMSATPKIEPTAQDMKKGIADYIEVDPDNVIAAGMIKKNLIINEGLDALVDDEKTSQDIIIEAAYLKRLALKEAYKEAGADINPLCLIQLPDSDSGIAKREVVEAFLADKGITEASGKLAVWLSEEKSDGLERISSQDSEVEFLMFKQAIDTGWDCPRAHILIKLRDTKSFTFEIQTVGRILRMPEQKHYDDESLNVGYIFTNLKTITVKKEDYNPNIIKHLKSVRKPIYQPLSLLSYHKSRVDFGDITAGFGKVLDQVFSEHFGLVIEPELMNTVENEKKLNAAGIKTTLTAYKEVLLTDKVIEGSHFDNIDGVLNEKIDETTQARLSDNDLQDFFNAIVQDHLNGFAPKRSVPTVRMAIYQWFKKYIGINYQVDDNAVLIQQIFLSDNNLDIFTTLLSKATGIYKPIKIEEVKTKIVETNYEWEVKVEEFYNQHKDIKVDYQLCIYEPCYLSVDRSKPEQDFEKHLEENVNSHIDWWFKNGESKRDFLGIKYLENNMPQTFYPDYVIQLKNGKVFIGDTKAGNTAKEAKERSEALQAYITTHNTSGKKLIGGILVLDTTKKWRLNQNTDYIYDKNDLTSWSFFDDVIN